MLSALVSLFLGLSMKQSLYKVASQRGAEPGWPCGIRSDGSGPTKTLFEAHGPSLSAWSPSGGVWYQQPERVDLGHLTPE